MTKMNRHSVRYIVVHCSATRSNMHYSAEQLDYDHRQRGFQQAGYHYYISRDGHITPLRPLDMPGAHARGYNRTSIAVCYEGVLMPDGTPADTRTPSQCVALDVLIRSLKRVFSRATVVGHRDLSPDRDGDGSVGPHEWLKVCPCFDAKEEYKDEP